MTDNGPDTLREADLPCISIVVIGRNEGERLVRCLESVRAADYAAHRIELIYVDTESTDDSCAVAEKLGAKVIRIQPERPTAAMARNAGLRSSRHALVHFLDGDTILHPSWFRIAVDAIVEPSVACVFGRREEVAPTATIYNFWAHHDWHVPPGDAQYCGGDALFRTEALRQVGGFDESLIAGEEQHLVFRMRQRGFTALSISEPMTLHNINMSRFSEYWRRCARAGFAYAEVSARLPHLRSYRRTCQRNVAHLVVAVAALTCSIMIQSGWPLLLWTALLLIAIVRNGVRCRDRVGSSAGAMLLSVHHYLSKIPTTAGQCNYWIRRLLSLAPQRLIEYRDPWKTHSFRRRR